MTLSDRIERLTQRLRNQKNSTVEFFNLIHDDVWALEVYSEGASWTVHEVLMHFVSSELGMARLITLIVSGETGVPEDFDLDRYNERKVDQLAGTTPQELLIHFAEARDRTIDMVTSFAQEDIDRRGRHPFLGWAKVEDMVQLIYRHNQIHQRDLRKLLSSMK